MTTSATKHWALASPFFQPGAANAWVTSHVPSDRHRFTSVAPRVDPKTVRHDGTQTSAAGWKLGWQQAADAFELRPDGIVTLFPQLPVLAGVRKRLTRRDVPVVAWCFNLGRLYHGAKGRLARFGLSAVDRIVCHSTFEVDQYSAWLRLPRERFTFVPLQRGELMIPDVVEDEETPFVVALGSANRDYATMFAAVEKLGYRTIVVAAPHAVAGLRVPANVNLRNNLSREACIALSQQARVNVVPVRNDETASGQVTVIQTMQVGKAQVATRCPGTRDYLIDGETALMTPTGDVEAMATAIRRLWDDAAERRRIGAAARTYARTNLSDAAAGANLARVLDEVTRGR